MKPGDQVNTYERADGNGGHNFDTEVVERAGFGKTKVRDRGTGEEQVVRNNRVEIREDNPRTKASFAQQVQANLDRVVAVAWGRRHYEDLAETLSSLPDGEREKAASHFARALSGTNPYYRSSQFETAASTPGYRVRGGTGTANYSRGHYQAVADAIKSYPGDKDALRKHLSDHFASTNSGFKPDTFAKASA
jgi:hypothetical protein